MVNLLIPLLLLFVTNIFCKNLQVDTELKYEWLTHKLQDGWSITPKGLNKEYYYLTPTSTTPAPTFETSDGATLLFNLNFQPFENLFLDFGLQAISNYADRYYQPVNDQHRMFSQNKNLKLIKTNTKYNFEFGSIRYFKGVPHSGWEFKCDMFNLLPPQYEVDRYRRVSGRVIPDGFEFLFDSKYGNLSIFTGEELVWGYKKGFYFHYNLNKFNIFFKNEIVAFGEPGERLQASEIYYNFSKFFIPTEVALLYQPFRLNQEYIYVEEVPEGSGLLNSKYLKKIDKTKTKDAIAGKLKLQKSIYPIFNNVSVLYTYSGLVAGNKQEVQIDLNKRLVNYFDVNFVYLFRKPIIGPVPLVYEGSGGYEKGPAIFNPRGQESPFWVNWDNRQTDAFSLNFTFDPTPVTWFYRYYPNILEDWNLNPEEDSTISFGFKIKAERFYTTTDRLFYYDENGDVVWEPYYLSGAWATKNYLLSSKLLTKILLQNYNIIFGVEFGESPAIGSFAYTTDVNKLKPLTRFSKIDLSLIKTNTQIKISYGQDIWGYEEWHRHFGESVDRVLTFSFIKKLWNNFEILAEYTRFRETDRKYYAPELGSFDEIRLQAVAKFNLIFED